ncbi:hypothetical protein LAZ67_10003167 [Cordylochernes scorpioides]|uniref:Uncharacterized protein n=1 Tax=Cordylochernes scorpioides TaxID=51811 RepID=A0ABY6KXS2_9ARAC|nr:hypothetical protein LAZ67_10003167 [Cordylochernes scorpioides]
MKKSLISTKISQLKEDIHRSHLKISLAIVLVLKTDDKFDEEVVIFVENPHAAAEHLVVPVIDVSKLFETGFPQSQPVKLRSSGHKPVWGGERYDHDKCSEKCHQTRYELEFVHASGRHVAYRDRRRHIEARHLTGIVLGGAGYNGRLLRMRKNVEQTPCAAAPNMEYKRCSSCIPGLGALTGYYQPGQLSPALYMADINPEEDIHTNKAPRLAGIVIRVHGPI